MSYNFNNEDRKIYMKFLIHKIIESKIIKLHNNISNNSADSRENSLFHEEKYNYSNIKKEFRNIINHNGGNYFIPYDNIYTRTIYFPYDTIFGNKNITENITDEETRNNNIKNIKNDNIDNDDIKNDDIDNDDIKKQFKEILKIKHIFARIGENNELINRIDRTIDDINNYIKQSNYNKNEARIMFKNFLIMIKNLNKKECSIIIQLAKKNNPDLVEKINKLCKRI
jgi:hypothetical protein